MSMLLTNAGPLLEGPEPAAGPTPVQMQDPDPPAVSLEGRILNGCVKAALTFVVPGEERAQQAAAEYHRRVDDLIARRFDGIREGFSRSTLSRERAALMARRDDVMRELGEATDRVNEQHRLYIERVRSGGDFRAALADKDAAELDRQQLTAAVAELNAAVNDATIAAARQWREVLAEGLGRLQASAWERQKQLLAQVAYSVCDVVAEAEALRAVAYLTVDNLRTKWGQLPEAPAAAPPV